VPFETPALLTDHFTKHGAEFGAADENDYLARADAFCYGQLDAHTEEHIRTTDGAVLRYNNLTNEFGVVGSDNFVKTYFKPSAGRRYFLRKCV
jgi:pyocin large subunit-like protein